MANSTKMTKLQQLYRSVYTSEPIQRLPSSWRSKELQPSFKFAPSGLSVTRVGEASPQRTNSRRSANDQNNSVEPSTAYPIVKIWDSSCYGLDNSGALYHSSPDTVLCPNGFKEKDIIGCGINFITSSLFFTKNGQFLGNAFEGIIPIYGTSEIHPVILMDGLQTKILTNFGETPFVYPFLKYLSSERFTQESQLVNALSRDFIDVKMREDDSVLQDVTPLPKTRLEKCPPFSGPKDICRRFLEGSFKEALTESNSNVTDTILIWDISITLVSLVAGYLVHHGYIETASSFSRWTKMGESASSPKKTRCDIDLTTASTTGGEAAAAEVLTESSAQSAVEPESFPGIGSMQHRRSLRSFCQRCKFGLVASTLNALYPRIVEKYPELILQLRCRQLIEMVQSATDNMHRHSVRLSGQGPTSSSSDSKLLLHQHQQKQQQLEEEGGGGRGSRKRPCVADTTSSEAACYVCTSGSVPTLAIYDDSRAQPLVHQVTLSEVMVTDETEFKFYRPAYKLPVFK
ncbi:hypothetical protein ACTXT7_009780 [Hymenolepis weldensis]